MSSSTIRVLGALMICALLVAAGAANARTADRGRYIVVLKESVDHPGTVAEAQMERRDGNLSAVYRHALKGYAATLPRDEVDALRNDPRVAFVTPDHQASILEEEVELETEENGAAEILEATLPTGISRIFAPGNEALDIDGEDDLRADVDVAVLDTGIDYEHPDLDVVARTSCVTGTCVNNTGEDGHSHGTHVAGTIGAIDNEEGVVGVAPGARMLAVKVLGDAGTGPESSLVAGVDWVTARAGEIEVANVSFGCPCSMPALEKAINSSVEAGVVYAVAAGNNNGNASSVSPANNSNVITVSAIADYDGQPGEKSSPTCANNGLDDRKYSKSNYGAGIEITAPGVCILSTVPGNNYGYKSGTSMAAPHVAGAAALLAAHNPPNSKADVEGIRETLVKTGNTGWLDTSGDGSLEPLLDVSDESIFSLRWTLQQPLNPGSGDRLLFDLACDQTESGDCTAVGRYMNAGVTTPLVQRFTEGSWSLQTAKAPGGASAFDGVACPSESSCIAVGGYEKTAGSGVLMLAEHWNGSSWSEASTPSPKNATAGFLAGIGCSSTSACTAVGYAVISGVRKPVAERWNGSTWAVEESVPVPAGATSSELYAVDCSSSTFCMAVGFYTNGSGKTRGFTATWNGTSWSLKAIVEPEKTVESSLHDVSCVESACTAVGAWQPGPSNQYNLVQRWNGSEWSLQTSPSNGQASVLQSVWCRTSTSCTAVGNFRSTESSPIKTLALQWTGTEWLIEPTPNPSGATFGALVGVSCQAPTDTCRGVGWYTESGTNKTLGAVRVGP
ncbi:MAG TPA: S8 family serine peptidase [Solirubrobacterales bacterium]|nr:S8 family serine peptidase [Solirubrobacterales bacterium]